MKKLFVSLASLVLVFSLDARAEGYRLTGSVLFEVAFQCASGFKFSPIQRVGTSRSVPVASADARMLYAYNTSGQPVHRIDDGSLFEKLIWQTDMTQTLDPISDGLYLALENAIFAVRLNPLYSGCNYIGYHVYAEGADQGRLTGVTAKQVAAANHAIAQGGNRNYPPAFPRFSSTEALVIPAHVPANLRKLAPFIRLDAFYR